MIKKTAKGYVVHAETGNKRKLGGPYATRKEAVERLRQVEYFKNKKSGTHNKARKK